MNKPAVLLCALTAVMLGLPVGAMAYDDDPGSGPDRPRPWMDGDRTWYGGRRSEYGAEPMKPIYYRPTQRYYGSGYTVSYRYIPVYRYESASSVPVTGATNFRSEARFHLSPEEVAAWGAGSPRLTVRDPKSAAPRTAITSIVRKKTSSRTPTKASSEAVPAEAPAIVPTVPSFEAPAKP